VLPLPGVAAAGVASLDLLAAALVAQGLLFLFRQSFDHLVEEWRAGHGS
jgi:hypothetical protein